MIYHLLPFVVGSLNLWLRMARDHLKFQNIQIFKFHAKSPVVPLNRYCRSKCNGKFSGLNSQYVNSPNHNKWPFILKLSASALCIYRWWCTQAISNYKISSLSFNVNSRPLSPAKVPAKGPFSKYLQIQFLRGASHRESARISQYETQIPWNALNRSQKVHPLVTQTPNLSWQFVSPVVLQFSSNLQSPSLSTFHGLY